MPRVVIAGDRSALLRPASGSGCGLTFFADEWAVIADRSSRSRTCSGRSTSTGWRSRSSSTGRCWRSFGMGAYVPYLALLAILHVTVALLVYALVRRRTLPWVAVGIALIVAALRERLREPVLGDPDRVRRGDRAGLGALLLLDECRRCRVRAGRSAATGLLTVAVMTSGYGLFMLGLVGLDVLLDPRRRLGRAAPGARPRCTARGTSPSGGARSRPTATRSRPRR